MNIRPANLAIGQESVWDYPRPPRLEACDKHIEIVFNNMVIAETDRALRVLETSHPPVYYLPPDDIRREFLVPTSTASFCEWKGQAKYYTVTVLGKSAQNAAWFYPEPKDQAKQIKGYVAFWKGVTVK